MKKMLWASLTTLLFLAVHQSHARADILGRMAPVGLGARMFACCVLTCDAHRPWFDECHGIVPGPWYLYWPYDGSGGMTSPVSSNHWHYENHFQTPAPIYPYWAASQGVYPTPSTGFQATGYYPDYWYGR
jgi:hypothetical protein